MAEPFSKRLNIAIQKNGITQSELCTKTGIPKSAMSQYLAGYFEPKHDRLYVLAQALGVSEGWLMGYDIPEERKGLADQSPEALELEELRKKVADGTNTPEEWERYGELLNHADFPLEKALYYLGGYIRKDGMEFMKLVMQVLPKLNQEGQEKAWEDFLNRTMELSEIPKYQNSPSDAQEAPLPSEDEITPENKKSPSERQ